MASTSRWDSPTKKVVSRRASEPSALNRLSTPKGGFHADLPFLSGYRCRSDRAWHVGRDAGEATAAKASRPERYLGWRRRAADAQHLQANDRRISSAVRTLPRRRRQGRIEIYYLRAGLLDPDPRAG